MDIDPQEVVIKWLETALTRAQGRVAGKHRYGVDGGWETGLPGVVVPFENGMPELYGEQVQLQTEIRIYGASPVAVIDIWKDLVALSRSTKRFTVTTSTGNALVHYFKQASGFSLIYDLDLKMDLGVAFFDTLIAEEVVT